MNKPASFSFLYRDLLIFCFIFLSGSARAYPQSSKVLQGTGQASDKQPLQRDSVQISGADSNSEYLKILSQLEQMDLSGQRATFVSQGFFQSLSWIGRTACINYVCGILSLDQCRRVLELGLSDDALVVRDHALRITISTKQFTEEEKRAAAERSVSDVRNYRKGRPFWIVDRARGYLVAESKNSATR